MKSIVRYSFSRHFCEFCGSSKAVMMAYLKETDEDDLYISKQLQELRVELDVKRREEERNFLILRYFFELIKSFDLLSMLYISLQSVIFTSLGDQSRAFGMAVSRLNNAMLVVEGDSKQLASSLRTISRLADNISSKFSFIFIGAGQSVSHSYEVLTNATRRLKGILERKLDAAIDNEDVAGIQRFVKLFPLINEHDKGLLQFGKYLSKKIIKIGDDNLKIMSVGGTDDKRVNVLYADTLFLFFEGIAALLETNQPIVENSYGPDKLLDFINILQVEIDQIVGKVIDSFTKKRHLEKRVKVVERLLRDERHVDKVGGAVPSLICATQPSYFSVVLKSRGFDLSLAHNDDFGDIDEEKKKRLGEEKVRRKEEREKKLDQLLNRSLVGSKMQRSDVETGKLEHAVGQLTDVSRKMHHLASLGMESLCKTAFRPKLRASCDSFVDLPHTLTDTQLAEFEAVDPFIEQFNATLDKQIASFEQLLHKENFHSLLLIVCSEVERQMERVIMKCSFNRLGGLQLDREFRQLSTYLSGIAGWTARERCARLAQVCSKGKCFVF
ncbi:unnamed protein product [Angiostrongylus costaricensis]|uniref:Conserved oligomeric Golgi complex subunit 4 n=1 Tax=Angiostrongylus costaricensis TaxID=334426 RepID=A0A158PIC4_ANGCS|nr:unnamed protein product [Angiostrongylus costaricensis]